MGTIFVENLLVTGVHGVLAEERERAQPFRIDLELTVDLDAAGVSDNLDDTVDYGTLSIAVARIVGEESYRLLERLARRIGDECLTDVRVERAVVTVRKLHAPLALHLDAVGVRLECSR